jgi:hypothetical protein
MRSLPDARRIRSVIKITSIRKFANDHILHPSERKNAKAAKTHAPVRKLDIRTT